MTHALRVLEFDAVRERLSEHCETSMSAAAALEVVPEWEAEAVWANLEETREAYDLIGKHSPPALGSVRDVRNALDRASKGAVLAGNEIFEIGDALAAMRAMRAFLAPKRGEYGRLWTYVEFLPEAKRLEEQIFDSLEPGGEVKDGASSQLASLRQRRKSATARLTERIQAYTTGSTRDYLSDPIYTVRDGRYVVPVRSEHRGKVKGIVHDTSATGHTVFVEPEDVLQLGNQLREIEAAERAEVQRILAALSGKVGAVAGEAMPGVERLGELDLVLARARYGYTLRGSFPQRSQTPSLNLHGAKHPLLDPAKTVPLDLTVGQGASVLITGPNTGGKTVAIKTVGLVVLMAQCGMMVPALDSRLGVFSQVWADIGDEQSIQQSLSTFSAHIRNISEAIQGLRRGALVLLDEIGAGTDPAEGAALATAILTEFDRKGAAVLASTHYGELKAFAYNTPGFTNAAMEFDQRTLKPTYRLMMGAPGASHALKIAERYGIPSAVVERAREGLGEQAQDVARMLERLEQAQRQARTAQSEADKRAANAKQSEARASRKLAEADEIRRNAAKRAEEAIEAALREIRLEAARLFEEVKRSGADPSRLEGARKGLRELQEAGSDLAADFRPKEKPSGPGGRLEAGTPVKIEGYTQIGTILGDPVGGHATVQIGVLKMTVPVAKLSVAGPPPAKQERAKPNLRLQKTLNAVTEIQLVGMRAEDAERELTKFLDDAVLGNLPSVRIVHGKGEGILRNVTREVLRRHRAVSNYRDGEPAEGGAGVTIATLG